MTVKELIKQLLDLPLDYKVECDLDDIHGYYDFGIYGQAHTVLFDDKDKIVTIEFT